MLECVKCNGLDIMVGVSIYYLMLNEFDVVDYCMFFKFILFLCSEEDWIEVIEVVNIGLIDIICLFYIL